MKVSIITSVYNCKDTIHEAIESVLSQTYENLEYIVIDAASTDGTMEIIQKYKDRITIISSQPDNGLYEGLNRGISLASGNIIGFLHADDFYRHNDVIKKIAVNFKSKHIDAIYGDLIYVGKENINKTLRYWKSGSFSYNKLSEGWMPPHPTFFVKREIYEELGTFDTTLNIAADYDFMLRVLTKRKYKIHYIPEVLYCMRIGGTSNKSLKSILKKSSEDLQVIHRNKIGGVVTLLRKNISKVPQLFKLKWDKYSFEQNIF